MTKLDTGRSRDTAREVARGARRLDVAFKPLEVMINHKPETIKLCY